MNHSAKFETVKNYYNQKLWNDYRVRCAVDKGWITAAEYTEITGNTF